MPVWRKPKLNASTCRWKGFGLEKLLLLVEPAFLGTWSCKRHMAELTELQRFLEIRCRSSVLACLNPIQLAPSVEDAHR